MSGPTTIPDACIEALGGLQDSDPAVRWRDEGGFEASWHPSDSSERSWPESDTPILVEQSEPALLRVLARHLGWQGNHRLFMTVEAGMGRPHWWALCNVTKWGGPPAFDEGPKFHARLPAHISTDLDYTDALAEAVVWYARSTRCEEATGFPADERLLERWNDDSSSMWSLLIETAPLPEVLAAIEQHLGLPTWAVTR